MSQTKDDEIKDPVDSIIGDLGQAKSDLSGVEMIEEDKYEDLLDETSSLSSVAPTQAQVTSDSNQTQPMPANSQITDDQTMAADDQKINVNNQIPVTSSSDSVSVDVPKTINNDVNEDRSTN